jgi:hypothetical protein
MFVYCYRCFIYDVDIILMTLLVSGKGFLLAVPIAIVALIRMAAAFGASVHHLSALCVLCGSCRKHRLHVSTQKAHISSSILNIAYQDKPEDIYGFQEP